jgi:hypothetical protein
MAVSSHLRFWTNQNLMSRGCHGLNEPDLNVPFMQCLESSRWYYTAGMMR